MVYRFSALVVMLALGAGVYADDKDKKKEPTTVKGKVVKVDHEKKCIKLKTADGEKDYTAGDELFIMINNGPKMKVSLKKEDGSNPGAQQMRMRSMYMLRMVLKEGNDVELVLANKDIIVKEVHFTNRPGAPVGRPAGAPTGAKPAVKADAQK